MVFEIRQAVRAVGSRPSFALTCMITLGLGIGVSAAVFSVVNGVLLQPLRFPEPERIISINTANKTRPAFPRVTGGDFSDIRSGNQVFDAISCYFGGEMGVQLEGHAEFTGIWWVNPEFFRIIGSSGFTGFGKTTAIVSAGFAARNFADPSRAPGRQIQVENQLYTIAGVLNGPGFPNKAEIWLMAPFVPENPNRTAYNYRALARLRPGIAVESAQANLNTIAARLATAHPDSNAEKKFVALPLRDQLVGPVRSTLYILLGAVLLVLLIACANVSNLLLARSTVRAREMAIRAALGATRARLVVQLVLESAVLAFGGALAGIALAWWGTRLLISFAPANLPRVDDIHVDYAVLGFALALAVLSAMLFGVLPALQASRVEFSSRGVLRGGSHVLRNSLVVAEIALSFVLATGAGLFFRSFLALNATDLGFKPDRMLVMYAHAPAKTLDENIRVSQTFTNELLPQLSLLPGVESAAAVMGLPTGAYGSNGSYQVVGKPKPAKALESIWALTSPQYFSTMRVPLLRGRDFTARDGFDAAGVAIISESMARQAFGSEDPIGRQVFCGLDKWTMQPMTIVGLVGDVRQTSPGMPPEPSMYMPLEQHPFRANEVQVILRTAGPPAPMSTAARGVAHRLIPDMAIRFTTLDSMISDTISAPRFRTFLSGVFAVLALLLAMAGIYGVMSYVVTQRTQELGLRMALGAAASDVLRLVMGRALLLTAAGLAIGGLLSAATSSLIASMLYGLKSSDPSTWVTAFASVAAIALLAAAGPAWRASRIDPMIALREE
jgi:putative ABC transport system permease protein